MKPGKHGIAGFGSAAPENKRALCVRDDGARADADFALKEVNELAARRLRLAGIGGARITALQPGAAAATAGLAAGDGMTALDSTEIVSSVQLQQMIHKLEPGRSPLFSPIRNGQLLRLSVVLGAQD